jgi:methylase of polypeptide subunit release factors
MEWNLSRQRSKQQKKSSALKKLAQYRKANVRPFFLWKFHFAEVFQEKGGFDFVIANPPYVRRSD